MNAHEVISLLRRRHTADVFVEECKDGRSWGPNGHLRMDAWAMNRSWANMIMTGYEIKVSRSDFLNDDKWQRYLPLCNRLYFATPRGLIKIEELPPEVGLLEVASTGTMLTTKRKAVHRTIEPPAELLCYILMCRAKIEDSTYNTRNGLNIEYWRNWLKEYQERKKIGIGVKDAIREKIAAVETENHRLLRLNEELNQVKEYVKSLGFDPNNFNRYQVEQIHRAQRQPIDIERIKQNAQNARVSIASIESLIAAL